MRERIGAPMLAAAALVVLVSACSVPALDEFTDPSPDPAPAPTLPPRPQIIDLATGVDACNLLTPEQQNQLGIDVPPKLGTEPDRYGNLRCHYDRIMSSPRYGYSLGAVTQEDASVYLTPERNAEAEVVFVAGFPAVQGRIPGGDSTCFVDVSTNEGQYLRVQYSESTGADDPPEVICENSRTAAEMAMETLLAQQ